MLQLPWRYIGLPYQTERVTLTLEPSFCLHKQCQRVTLPDNIALAAGLLYSMQTLAFSDPFARITLLLGWPYLYVIVAKIQRIMFYSIMFFCNKGYFNGH